MWVVIVTYSFISTITVNGLENIALGKPVWETHPWPGAENWRANKAVDGRHEDRSPDGNQCVISGYNAETATWRVDLGGVVSISHIDIYYRTDNQPRPSSYTSRMAGFFLYISNTTSKEDGHLCFHEIQSVNGTPSEDQKINCSVHGRYVIYHNERRHDVTYPDFFSEDAYYELCELEVYGCSRCSYYGSNCTSLCPTNCQERRCDINTGHCLGCLPGYHGPRCNQECNAGYYGKNCLQNCSEHCNVTRRCNRFTGECEGGCKQGWSGITCHHMAGAQDTHFTCFGTIMSYACPFVSVFIVLIESCINYVCWKRKYKSTEDQQEKYKEPQLYENSNISKLHNETN